MNQQYGGAGQAQQYGGGLAGGQYQSQQAARQQYGQSNAEQYQQLGYGNLPQKQAVYSDVAGGAAGSQYQAATNYGASPMYSSSPSQPTQQQYGGVNQQQQQHYGTPTQYQTAAPMMSQPPANTSRDDIPWTFQQDDDEVRISFSLADVRAKLNQPKGSVSYNLELTTSLTASRIKLKCTGEKGSVVVVQGKLYKPVRDRDPIVDDDNDEGRVTYVLAKRSPGPWPNLLHDPNVLKNQSRNRSQGPVETKVCLLQ